MNPGKLTGLLGMCRRCGRLVTGFDAVAALCGTPGVLLLTAEDTAARTKKELRFRAARYPVYTVPLSKEDIASAVGLEKPVAVLAVTDEGFARALRPLCLLPEVNHDLEEEFHYDD